MRLPSVLDRCHRLEERAAALYRDFAASCREQPGLCALWTGLAREEEHHARSIAEARAAIDPAAGDRTTLDGWEEALAEVEDRLATAERLGAGAPLPQKLAAALDLEMTALEAARLAVLAAARAPEQRDQLGHAERLADAAEKLTDDPQVRLQVALLRARARLQRAGA